MSLRPPQGLDQAAAMEPRSDTGASVGFKYTIRVPPLKCEGGAVGVVSRLGGHVQPGLWFCGTGVLGGKIGRVSHT